MAFASTSRCPGDGSTGGTTPTLTPAQRHHRSAQYMTDIYLSRSSDGGSTFAPNVRVSTASSNEHDCNGLFPCPAINSGNTQGDYSALVPSDGMAHPLWPH